MTIKNIKVSTAKQWLEDNEAILIDVREPAEHAAQNIMGSALHPLGSICCSALEPTDKKILIYCQKGIRGKRACEKLIAENNALNVYNIDGGFEAWKQAGFAVEGSGKNLLPIDQQVQLTIGLGVLVFSLLGYMVNPAFSLGSAFFGAGLVNAGLTGWCGLTKLLAKMPWNK